MLRKILGLSFVLASISLITLPILNLNADEGCGGSCKGMKAVKIDRYGEKITPIVKICHLLASPNKFNGKKVIVEGKISNECKSGCWFIIQCTNNKSKKILTLVSKKIKKIPQRVGYYVRVVGKVAMKGKKVSLKASGIEISKSNIAVKKEKCEKCKKMAKGKKSEGKPQTKCPIMGGDINKQVYTDYKGKRIYFCCKGCPEKFKKDPEKYMKEFKEKGTKLADTPKAE